MSTLKQRFVTSLLILLAMGSVILAVYFNRDTHPKQKTANGTPDIYAYNIHVKRFDENGRLASTFETPTLMHYSEDDHATFTQPHVIMYSETEPPWEIHALNGLAKNSYNDILLTDSVQLHQDAGHKNNDVTIRTSELNLDVKTQVASGSKAVEISQKANDNSVSIIKSIGFRVDQQTGIINLLSHAQGYYAKNTG